MADTYDEFVPSNTYSEDDSVGGGEQTASTVYVNEQFKAQEGLIGGMQSKVPVQPTPPQSPDDGAIWIDNSQAPLEIWRKYDAISGLWVELGRTDLSHMGGKLITSQLGIGIVDEQALADAAVTVDKIASRTITTEKISIGTITYEELAPRTITADRISLGSITSTEIGDQAIQTVNIAANAITSALIQANAIEANHILAGAITAEKIGANIITALHIAANTITANQIAAGTITATELAANSITAAKIVAGTITSNEIATGTIVANDIAAGTITGAEIAARTIAAGHIIAATITGNEIAARTIVANNIQAGSITANEIQANTITTNLISTIGLSADVIKGGIIKGIQFETSDDGKAIVITNDVLTSYFDRLNSMAGSPVLTIDSGELRIYRTQSVDAVTVQASLVEFNNFGYLHTYGDMSVRSEGTMDIRSVGDMHINADDIFINSWIYLESYVHLENATSITTGNRNMFGSTGDTTIARSALSQEITFQFNSVGTLIATHKDGRYATFIPNSKTF